MPSIFQNFKDVFTYDYHELLMTKNWMVLLGYFHIFVIFSFKGHLKMSAVYHSTYLWHDLKTLQNLKAVEGVGAKCRELGRDRGMYMCMWESVGFECFFFCDNLSFLSSFLGWGNMTSAAYLIL